MEKDIQSTPGAAILAELQRQNVLLENIQVRLEDQSHIAPVWIETFNMPFDAMVGLIIKWLFASIPAGIIVGVVLGMIWLLLVVVFGIGAAALY